MGAEARPSPRNGLGAVVAITTLLALTACSNDGAPPAQAQPPVRESTSSSPAGSPVPSQGPSQGPSAPPGTPEMGFDRTTGEADYCKDQKTPFTGEAADKFGAKNVMRAYCEMVTLSMTQSWVPDLMRKDGDDLREIEFSIPRQYMTPTAANDWDKLVASAVKGEQKHLYDVWALMLYNVTLAEGYELFPPEAQEPMVLNQRFFPAQSWIDTATDEDRLGLRFVIAGDLHLTKDGEPHLLPTEKEIHFALVQNGGHPEKPWLIDSWSGEWTFGKDPRKR
jgi:hypothetical protein